MLIGVLIVHINASGLERVGWVVCVEWSADRDVVQPEVQTELTW